MNFHMLQRAVYYNMLFSKRCLVSLQWNAFNADRTYFLTVYILTASIHSECGKFSSDKADGA